MELYLLFQTDGSRGLGLETHLMSCDVIHLFVLEYDSARFPSPSGWPNQVGVIISR